MRILGPLLLCRVNALVKSPSSIEELLGWVYPTDTPQFVQVDSPAPMAISGNESSILKLGSVNIQPYPLRAGYVDFAYLNNIVDDVPSGSKMTVSSFLDGKKWHSGTLEVCQYLPFAKLDCPIAKYQNGAQRNETKLSVPANGYDNRFSFVIEIRTPTDELVLHLAAIIDCQEGHDEL